MIDYIQNNQPSFWFSLGFLLLVIEALVLGFTSGVVLFAGLGGLITGGMMWFGVIPHSWFAGFVTFGLSSGVAASLLWKPLLRLQNFDTPAKDNSSDLIGHRFRLTAPITLTTPGTTRYSGIEWRVEIDPEASNATEIGAGELVEVSSVDAGLFRVTSTNTE